MKRITTTLVLALIAVAAIAGHQNASTVVLTTFDHNTFIVQLDGQRYQGINRLEISDIAPGRHKLRIDSRRSSHHGNGGAGKIIYNGYIDVPARSMVDAYVTKHRSLRVDVVPMHAMCTQGCPPNACTCGVTPIGCNEVHYGQQCQAAHPQYGNQLAPSNGTIACADPYSYTGQYGSQHWLPIMTDAGFTDFRRSLQTMSFESSKLSAIGDQLRHVRYTSAQTRTLMSLFSFDSSKLELAKMAYVSVVDPQQFYLVAEAFTFNATRQELYHFMQV